MSTKSRHIPLRSCIACGSKMPKVKLVRLVKTEQKAVTVDTIGTEPGRGAYVCQSTDCWDRVLGKGILDRSFKRSLSANDLESVRIYYQENVAPQGNHPKTLNS